MEEQNVNNKVIELKARAYDILAQIEYLQSQLRQINSEIAKELKGDTNGG